MPDRPFNNIARLALAQPDAYGHAAILLLESLIHALVARSLLSLVEAIEIVDIAADVAHQAGSRQGLEEPMSKSKAILHAISFSLGFDTSVT